MSADYERYGPEWEREVMKNRKIDIVRMVKNARQDLDHSIEHIRSMLDLAKSNGFESITAAVVAAVKAKGGQ